MGCLALCIGLQALHVMSALLSQIIWCHNINPPQRIHYRHTLGSFFAHLNLLCLVSVERTMCEYTNYEHNVWVHTRAHSTSSTFTSKRFNAFVEAWKCDFIQSSYPPYILSPRKHSRAPPENRSQDALFSDASWGCLLPLSPITAYGEVYLPWHNPGFYLQLSASE